MRNRCYSFHRTKWRLVTSICRGPGPVATRMPFFSPKFKSTANFSAAAHEGNLFFLSGRSARKKTHNFPIKSSHLCRTWRHVWLSSCACDQTSFFFFFFSPTLIFLSFFSKCGSWSQATSYISLNTNSCTLTDCTFALGGISIPCSLFTSHFSIAFKCEPSVTRVLNCLSVLVVLTDFKAVIYITRGSTVSFI